MLTKSLLLLLALVETGNKDVDAYKGDATGPFQERVVCVNEANRIVYLQDKSLGENFYSLDDRHDYHMARSIAFVVIDFWKPKLEEKYECKWDEYDVLSFWLYGPNKWRPFSKNTNESKKRNKRFDYYKKQQKK